MENLKSHAEYDKLEDGTFSGRIPGCKGVVAFGKTLRECENELQSTLEDWVFFGLKLRHKLPVIDRFDRSLKFDLPPLSNDELVQNAEEIFLELDRRESENDKPKARRSVAG